MYNPTVIHSFIQASCVKGVRLASLHLSLLQGHNTQVCAILGLKGKFHTRDRAHCCPMCP